MHKFIDINDIPNATSEPDCDVIVASAAWGDSFLSHHLTNIQRNHKLCLDKLEQQYEYVFLMHRDEYNKYKDKFTIPNITFIFFEGPLPRVLIGIHMEYAYYRKKPLISFGCDCLHTSNLLPNLLTKYSHYDACCVMSQRVYYNILDALRAKEAQIPYEDIFKPREFLKIIFPYLYVTDQRYFMDDYRAMGCYNGFFWPVRKNGVIIGELMRAFHWGVIYVKNPCPGMEKSHPTLGLDVNPFLGKLATPETVGMVADSDDGFCVDVMREGFPGIPDPVPRLTDLSEIVKYWHIYDNDRGISAINESNMGYNVAIHSEPLDQEWVELAKQVDDFVTNIYGGAIKNKPLTWGMLP